MDETTRRQTIMHLSTYSSTLGSGITTKEQHQEAKNICIELLEQVEDIKTQMCDHYCKYRDEWDEDDGPIEDVICKSCPMTRL